MALQIKHNINGKDSGVFILNKDWELIKKNYPDIEDLSDDNPVWQDAILHERLQAIKDNPERVKPIAKLLDVLNKRIQ
jgi:hypothetical protein